MKRSDFRSDTVTLPSDGMRDAMFNAELGDDVLEGDPTVRKLEAAAADWLGKEGALFVPSGTMANQVALGSWTRPGDEIIVQRWAHVTTFEGGAAGMLHGLQSITLGDISGRFDPEEVRASIRPPLIHCPKTALICTEQTHNVAGGKILPLADLQAIRATAVEADIPVHMDGARLANAVVASGVSAREWSATADSVSLCLSKGLGAPVGSVIAGPTDFLERARLIRKRLGGWMRQAGFLAGAGLWALENNIERLALDHQLARQLASGLAGIDGLSADPASVDTNIVMVEVDATRTTPNALMSALAERGVLVIPMGPTVLRFVTHLGLDGTDVDRLVSAATEIMEGSQ
ncbi:MAG: threonine aldolase [Planctomycetota bacterium]|jgi:threonine aldolase